MDASFAEAAAETIIKGIGRRDFVRAVAAMGAGVGLTATAASCATASETPKATGAATGNFEVLQPDQGDISGDHYLQSNPDQVLWGYVPNVHATPVMRMRSEETITIDTVSHGGI